VTAFVATYWSFMTLGVTEKGVPIAPIAVTHGLALASLVVAVCARVSLGRNIGFVPAQRELVTSWAYAVVRHPIYAGLFLSLAGFVLRAYSPLNLLIAVINAGLFVVKTFMEEDFLGEDPTYARYMERVRYRWVPGIA
jgi:protein-S-isoprenylcysteine O-methyltransferase Ste14